MELRTFTANDKYTLEEHFNKWVAEYQQQVNCFEILSLYANVRVTDFNGNSALSFTLQVLWNFLPTQ